ncbi:hypothetical protein PG988_007202 [Apiospora saccharicola]
MEGTIKPDMIHLDKFREQFLAEINSTITNNNNVKRRPDKKHFPNVYEMPGGKVDETDATIGHAIAREVLEESNLQVRAVLKPLSVFTYTTASAAGTRNVVQLSYVVQVEDAEFRVNPEEHTEGVWADREMVEELEITKDMKDLIVEALAMKL